MNLHPIKEIAMGESFKSLNWLRGTIRFVLEVLAALSFLLLTIGLVSASWNFLDKDAIFGNAPQLQSLWALDQALAIDANLPLTFVVLYAAYRRREWIIVGIYTVIGIMLLFVAAVILGTESLRQALNITLEDAAKVIHVPIELLTLMRSAATIGLVAMSGLNLTMSRVHKGKEAATPETAKQETTPTAQQEATTTSKEPETKAKQPKVDYYQKYLETIATTPKEDATIPKLAAKLGVSPSTISNYRKRHSKSSDELKVPTPATYTEEVYPKAAIG